MITWEKALAMLGYPPRDDRRTPSPGAGGERPPLLTMAEAMANGRDYFRAVCGVKV